MAKRISQMTTAQLKDYMSIAGEPDKVIEAMQDIFTVITSKIDLKNIPSLDNMQLALQRVNAELKQWEKTERKRQHR